MTAGAGRREGQRSDDGLEGCLSREAAGSVKKLANRAGVGVEAHGVDGGGGRRKPDHIDRKTKK